MNKGPIKSIEEGGEAKTQDGIFHLKFPSGARRDTVPVIIRNNVFDKKSIEIKDNMSISFSDENKVTVRSSDGETMTFRYNEFQTLF